MQAEHAPLREDADGNLPGHAPPGPSHQRWRRDALQPPEVLQDAFIFLLEVFVAFRGIREGFLDLLPPLKCQGN